MKQYTSNIKKVSLSWDFKEAGGRESLWEAGNGLVRAPRGWKGWAGLQVMLVAGGLRRRGLRALACPPPPTFRAFWERWALQSGRAAAPSSPGASRALLGEGAAVLKRHFRGSLGSQALRGEVRLPWSLPFLLVFMLLLIVVAVGLRNVSVYMGLGVCMGLGVLSEGLF